MFPSFCSKYQNELLYIVSFITKIKCSVSFTRLTLKYEEINSYRENKPVNEDRKCKITNACKYRFNSFSIKLH